MRVSRSDLDLARRLMVHEAEVQRNAGRELRDLGDGWLLHDPADPEPFWNRLVAPRWPTEPARFERRLDEVVTLFATLDRIPHVRPLPLGNEPQDLVERLLRSGFERRAEDLRMVLRDPAACRDLAARGLGPEPGSNGRLRVTRHPGGPGGPPRMWAADASLVLAEAFEVDPYRRAALEADLLACAARPECSVLILFDADEPVATARRTTIGGGTYLSSIGTRPGWRGRGHGALVTALATCDAIGLGDPGARGSLRDGDGRSPFVHLAVETSNVTARRLYERLGFEVVGEPVPDLIAR